MVSMRNLILGDICRCVGEVIGDAWGDPYKICHARDYCARHLQLEIDRKGPPKMISTSGWLCATEEKENLIPVEQQQELLG